MSKTFEIKDTKARFVCEAFGMSNTVFAEVHTTMVEYFTKQDNADNVKSTTKTELLELFLQSPEFAALNFHPETPNEIFLFGYMFAMIVKTSNDGIPDFIKKALIDTITHEEHTAKKGKKNIN